MPDVKTTIDILGCHTKVRYRKVRMFEWGQKPSFNVGLYHLNSTGNDMRGVESELRNRKSVSAYKSAQLSRFITGAKKLRIEYKYAFDRAIRTLFPATPRPNPKQ